MVLALVAVISVLSGTTRDVGARVKYPAFIGGSSQTLAVSADNQRTFNLFPELIESGGGKNQAVLLGTPGLSTYATLTGFTGTGHRGSFQQDGRAFFVVGDTFYELDSSGNLFTRGTVADDGLPCTFCSNGLGGHQIFITAGKRGYIFDLIANSLTQIVGQPGFPAAVRMGLFVDGYFLALWDNSDRFSASALENGLTWSGTNVGERSIRSDNFVAMVNTQRLVALIGTKTTELWYDSAATFPFAPIPSALIEYGGEAPWSAVIFDGVLTWLAMSNTGGRFCAQVQNYNAARISTHAVEAVWNTYTRVDDAEAFVYQEMGHTFYVLNFPTANTTWVYDAATKLWHERGWWNGATHDRILARSHLYYNGAHLVGDRSSGKLFKQSLAYYDDAGTAKHWSRRAPHLAQENRRIYYDRFELEFDRGLGLTTGQGSDPKVVLRWSDDGGITFSNEHWASLGKVGVTRQRAVWNRLGMGRDRVFEVSGSDPIPIRITDAYLRLRPGSN